MGANDALHTLKGLSQGRWRPAVQLRQERLIEWIGGRLPIDPQRIHVNMGVWGALELERPDIYSWLNGWVQPDFTLGFQCLNHARGAWGPPGVYQGRPDVENPYRRSRYADYALADPGKEMPYLLLHSSTGAHNTEMGWPPFPQFFRAMTDSKRAFSAAWGKHSWVWPQTPVYREIFARKIDIQRDQTLPAFGNCTLDDNPGCGDLASGDNSGQLNGYLLWDTAGMVDEPGKWEMTIWLDASAPKDTCLVDLTPRRCQRLRLKDGSAFRWDNLDEKGLSAGTGKGRADKFGLATIEKLTITKAKHRIRVSAE
jgi:hypothetical protein